MLDIYLLRNKLDYIVAQMQRRRFNFDVDAFQEFESKRKALQVETENLQNEANKNSKAFGQAKSKGEDTTALATRGAELKAATEAIAKQLDLIQDKLHMLLSGVPNILHADVPEGSDEADNVEVKKWGKLPEFNFEVKDHVALGTQHNGIDFDVATKLAGSRFVVLKSDIAAMHRALAQFMLDLHTTLHGYQEVNVPFIANAASLFGTSQLPKFAEDLFAIKDDRNFYLIPTSEVPLVNLVQDKILDLEELPLKLTAHTPCFRSEAGSYGKDTHGMIRQHQFEKVELVQIVHPELSYQAHEEIVLHAEKVLELLELPYRRVILSSGDTGFAAAKTYDLEVWLPGQQRYREISSCSNTEAFQARRMKARFRSGPKAKPEFVHTLNGSGVAIGRALIAVMENYQQEGGSIAVPKVLQKYMQGKTIIEA